MRRRLVNGAVILAFLHSGQCVGQLFSFDTPLSIAWRHPGCIPILRALGNHLKHSHYLNKDARVHSESLVFPSGETILNSLPLLPVSGTPTRISKKLDASASDILKSAELTHPLTRIIGQVLPNEETISSEAPGNRIYNLSLNELPEILRSLGGEWEPSSSDPDIRKRKSLQTDIPQSALDSVVGKIIVGVSGDHPKTMLVQLYGGVITRAFTVETSNKVQLIYATVWTPTDGEIVVSLDHRGRLTPSEPSYYTYRAHRIGGPSSSNPLVGPK